MSPRNGVRTGTSLWTTDHTGAFAPVLSPKLEWTSAALRRRRLPVRIRPGTLRARSSTRRAPLSQGGGQGCNSPRVHGSAVRLDGHSRPKRDGAGSNPAGATTVSGDATSVILARSPSRSPTVIGKTSGSTGFDSPASPPIRGRSSVGRAGPSPPPRLRSHADRRSMVIAAWVRIPAPPHLVTRGRSSVAEQLHTIATTCSLARRTDG
jgi:hypothetical protein